MVPHFQLFRGNRVKYFTCGEGEPLLLLHGYQADSRIWEKMIPLLKKNFYLIIPDLPGHGHSPLIHPTNSMQMLADVAFSVTMASGFNKINIIGHSMGGYIALAFAKKYAKMAQKLILINSHPFEDSITKILARDREADLILQGKKDLMLNTFVQNNFSKKSKVSLKKEIEYATNIARSQSKEGMLADIVGMMARYNTSHLLNSKKFTVDFIFGVDDPKISPKEIEAFGSKDSKTLWLEDCGHMAILEQPVIIHKFIEELFKLNSN